ncbi:hypothetical protein B0H13DRAFT_1889654 [Mycena leptocephala]|nr:hypothetical protein B0H13DRAFT_1889654 [Mycena leptocephala]
MAPTWHLMLFMSFSLKSLFSLRYKVPPTLDLRPTWPDMALGAFHVVSTLAAYHKLRQDKGYLQISLKDTGIVFCIQFRRRFASQQREPVGVYFTAEPFSSKHQAHFFGHVGNI